MEERMDEAGERPLHKVIADFRYLQNCIITVRERTGLTGMELLDAVLTELANSNRYSEEDLWSIEQEYLKMISDSQDLELP